MASRASVQLDKATVLNAAFALLEREGLDKLTLRALARDLSVQAPAFYWHFRDKNELLTLMMRQIYEILPDDLKEHESWRDFLSGYGRTLWNRLAQQRDAVRLCAIATPGENEPSTVRHAMTLGLTSRGLTESQALKALSSVISLAIGWATLQGNRPMHDFLDTMFEFDAMIKFDAMFEQSLERMLDGFAQHFRESVS